MNRIRTAGFGGGDNFITTQIGFAARWITDAIGFIGHRHMASISIGSGIHGNGTNTEFLRGFNNTASNFATIGNQ